jgi:beta-galactosidase
MKLLVTKQFVFPNDDSARKFQHSSTLNLNNGSPFIAHLPYNGGNNRKGGFFVTSHTPFSRFLFGGDYNPEQWPRSVWADDMQILTDVHMNEATINVFSWAQLQPSEAEYDFSTLDDIVATLTKNHFDIVLATATAALPAWLATRYPEVTRTDYDGRHAQFGGRHNACPNSPVFRHYSALLAGKLAERYGHLANVVCWHISNEYGGYCYCANCAKAFRVWLRKKYGSLTALNDAWYTHFWGHTFYDWEEIVPPTALSDGIGPDHIVLSAMGIDYRRFQSDSLLQNLMDEKTAIRDFDPDTPITTNMMGTFKDLDYFKWAKALDIVSWDSYPAYDTPHSEVAMRHDLMRGLKGGQPFMLMEQTPSQQNWQPYNATKRPGQMRAMSFQAIAHGADTIQYFQLRQGRGGTEKFHGAIISHADHDETRIIRETRALGSELAATGPQLMNGRTHAKVGIIFDWENYWSLEYSSGPSVELKYVDQIRRYYAAFYRQNVAVDMIPTNLSAAEMAHYDVIVAPVLIMVKPGVSAALHQYVENGGTFVTTYMSGINDENDQVIMGGYPGPFRDLCGIWAEEIDALPPHTSIPVQFGDSHVSGSIVANVSHLEGAQSLASYGGADFYADTPAVTVNPWGNGQAYYVGTVLDDAGLNVLVDRLIQEKQLAHFETPTDVELTTRYYDGYALHFLINNTAQPATVDTSRFTGLPTLIGTNAVQAETILAPYDVLVIKDKE